MAEKTIDFNFTTNTVFIDNKISLTEHFNLQNKKLQHTKTETIKQYDST